MPLKSGSPAAAQILKDFGLASLPSDWSIVRVEDLLSDDRGISVGVMYPGDHDPIGVPLIRAADLAGNRVNPQVNFRITQDKHREYRRTALTGGELLISLVGDIGRCAIVQPESSGWNAARAIAVLRFARLTDAEFVRLCLMSSPLRHLMHAWATTTVQETLNLKEIRQLPLPWPPEKQRATIASILSALDDKIDLNRRMNETLEATARAIFKDWFVDFGPTQAKMEGRAPYLAPEIWSLFPDRLDNESKPQGWEWGTLAGCANLNPESWSRSAYPALIEYVDLSGTKWGSIETTEVHDREHAPSRAQRVLRPDDTIVGMVRPGNGSYAFVSKNGLTGSTGFAVLRPRQSDLREFVYLAATAPENIDRLSHLADGAAYPAVRPEVVLATEVVAPAETLTRAFSAITGPLVNRMESNKQESGTLAATRDLLLPKLMSGEIRVRDAEKIAEAAQ